MKIHIKTKLAAFGTAALLAAYSIVPCSAAEAPPLNDAPISTSPGVLSSDLVPVERTSSNINGEMVITEVFEISALADPNALIKPDFAQNGCLYTMESIVKDSYTDTKEKDVTKEYEAPAASKELSENIGKLPSSLAYSEEGYTGLLHLDPQSVQIVVTERKPQTSSKSVTKTFNVEYNDPSQIPTSQDGLPLTGLTWSEDTAADGDSAPGGYIATAVYSKKTTYDVDSAWKMVATYQGTVQFEDTNDLRYTVTYKGTPIPKGYVVGEDGQLVKEEGVDAAGILLRVIAAMAVAAVIAIAVLAILWAFKRGYLYSRKLTVQAQDFDTGNYKVVQKVRLNKKAPNFKLDTLKSPSSRHYLCEMSPQMAVAFRGKIINVTADGQIVCKHQVEPQDTTGKYVFSIDLEPVGSGPIDSFAL